jgi:hypothetical protein
MPTTYTITITDSEWAALSWKFPDPQAHLLTMIRERSVAGINTIAKEEIRKRLQNPNYNQSIVADAAALVASMDLKTAIEREQIAEAKMKRMMADPDDVDPPELY